MDGGASAWHSYPDFVENVSFGRYVPDKIQNLQNTDLAARLNRMFAISVWTGQLHDHRFSFWTGEEADDIPLEAERREPPSPVLRGVAPETPDFALDKIDTPRAYISMLLGGGSNLWSNVDLTGAFATAVTGTAVVPHMTPRPAQPGSYRESFTGIAKRLRPGLRAVIESRGGTANTAFSDTDALAWLRGMPGVQAYGKTGTLRPSEEAGSRQTSRMLLVLLRSGSGAQGEEKGLALSLVVESANQGDATRWMGEFLATHGRELQRWLQ
jgi:hypothetical protein